MRTATLITYLLSGLLLVSCTRTPSSTPIIKERSVEQSVTELEQHLGPNIPRLSTAEARKQYERDLAELQRMGLVERAQLDFSSRHSNATIEAWTIGYVMNTNTVWCDVRYRIPGGTETLQKEYGYSRKTGTNWSLLWRVGGQPE